MIQHVVIVYLLKETLPLAQFMISISISRHSSEIALFFTQNDEQVLAVEERRGAEWAPGVLDPLLKIISREYIDNADLSIRLQNLFYVSTASAVSE